MQSFEFEHYHLAWATYVGLGLMFVVLWYYVSRSWSAWINVPLISLMSAMIFTPATSLKTESVYLAPATLVAIFDGEQLGIEAFIQGIIPVGLSWLTLCIVFSMIVFFARKRTKKQ
jgi:hypothetical protein